MPQLEKASFTVESVAEFVDIVVGERTPDLHGDSASIRQVYRGQANRDWGLLPGIFRKQEDYENERVFLREFLRRCPESTRGGDRFDTLVTAQEFGVPTRLLDVTFNPLVALYFACLGEPSSDGAVYRFTSVAFGQGTPACRVAMAWLFDFDQGGGHPSRPTPERLAELAAEPGRPKIDPREADALMTREEPLLVCPRNSNERLRAQQGAFLLCFSPDGNATDESGSVLRRFEVACVRPDSDVPTILVPSERKAALLDGLRVLGIDEASLFPDLEHRVNQLVKDVSSASKLQIRG